MIFKFHCQDFLFIFGFLQCDYGFLRCGYLCIEPIWSLLSFLNVEISIFNQIWLIWGHSTYFPSFSFSLVLLGFSIHTCWYAWLCPTGFWVCSFFLFFFLSILPTEQFLLICLQVHWFFCHLKSAVDPSEWIFHRSSCLFQLQNFYLVFFLNFYFSIFSICWIIIMIFFKHDFLWNFFEHTYNSIFEVLHTKYNIWAHLNTVSIDFFFPWVQITFLFLCMYHRFCWKLAIW